MPAFKDLSGKIFGRWTVLRRGENNRHNQPQWHVQCECGAFGLVVAGRLTSGKSRSCGCLNLEVRRRVCIERNTTHGKSKTKAYNAWVNIRQRCENPDIPAFAKYGAKGISVCDRWQTFELFHADMGNPPTPSHTIDRINSAGDYEPGNCRWATQLQQQNNRSSNRLITAFGKTKTLQQWCRERGYSHKTITGRLSRGWETERALTEPAVRGRNQY